MSSVSTVVAAPAAKTAPALWPGLTLALLGSVAFSGKAIIVKLAYRYGVDAVTLITYRMLFALPLFTLLALPVRYHAVHNVGVRWRARKEIRHGA